MYYDKEHYEPNEEKFKEVSEMIKSGIPLNFNMLHYIFGRPFFKIMLMTLCDSRQDIINLIMKDKNELDS